MDAEYGSLRQVATPFFVIQNEWAYNSISALFRALAFDAEGASKHRDVPFRT